MGGGKLGCVKGGLRADLAGFVLGGCVFKLLSKGQFRAARELQSEGAVTSLATVNNFQPSGKRRPLVARTPPALRLREAHSFAPQSQPQKPTAQLWTRTPNFVRAVARGATSDSFSRRFPGASGAPWSFLRPTGRLKLHRVRQAVAELGQPATPPTNQLACLSKKPKSSAARPR